MALAAVVVGFHLTETAATKELTELQPNLTPAQLCMCLSVCVFAML